MKFDLMHPADQIVLIMERIYGYGMTTTSGGNLSIKDENGDIWITPGGVDKGSLTRNDIMRITPDGEVIGIHKPSIELPFHQMVYKIRPDVNAVLHAHPPALISFSIARKIPDTNLIPNARLVCGEVGMAEYDVPGSIKLGENIGEVLKKGIDTVMLENHGIVVAGKDLFQAFMKFETLDFCARLEIKANRIGTPKSIPQKSLEMIKNKQNPKLEEFEPSSYNSLERAVRRDMCSLIRRAYNQKLFTSTQGTFSQKLGDNSFIITPYGIDRKYIEAEDLVRIENGKCEKGKVPSRSVILHQKIYEKNPDIESIIIAHPPNIMAFSITDEVFDSKLIPESFVMLQDIPKLEFGTSFMDPEATADCFSNKVSCVMLKNDCLIVTGKSLINAFDRLEVAEYSAKAVISTRAVGDIVKISDEQIKEIKEVFGL